MSVLKWIWGLLRELFSWLRHLVQFVLDSVSCALTWIIGGIAYLVHSLTVYVGDFFEGLFENLTQVSLAGYPVSSLGIWIARDIVALDVAWECFAIYFSVWVASRIARSSFAIVRLILDIL